jgi:chromosome segregation ATPase
MPNINVEAETEAFRTRVVQELEAEVEKRTKLQEATLKQLVKSRMEVGRLREQQARLMNGWDDWDKQLREARAEVERLRAAATPLYRRYHKHVIQAHSVDPPEISVPTALLKPIWLSLRETVDPLASDKP